MKSSKQITARSTGKTTQGFGGLAARAGKGPLWRFTDRNDGSFVIPDAQYVSGLYFPLFNDKGMKCSVSPQFKGDICSSFQDYLTYPSTTEDLHRCLHSRNFWVCVSGKEPWSVTGVGASTSTKMWSDPEPTVLEAGVGHFTVTRTHQKLGLKATVTCFVPSVPQYVELMKVRIENISRKPMRLTATAATPMHARPADNLRDHHNVTSMFGRVEVTPHGVIVHPVIYHEETGHRINHSHFAVLGFGPKGQAPAEIWSALGDFIGEGGNLESPEAVYRELKAPRHSSADRQGREAIGAMRFAPVTLRPGQAISFVVIHGIAYDRKEIDTFKRYGREARFDQLLTATAATWQELTGTVGFNTADKTFDNWMRWVSLGPLVRKVYGCSYLLDVDYGRGGRGWRDLWQDLLGILLVSPSGAREEMVNSFAGVRVDGTNASLIGTAPGEFIADRNNIARTWCDHGSWPCHVLNFYMDQTGDFDILFQQIPYWKDAFVHRGKARDEQWDSAQGNRQLTERGQEYKGTILEHVLLENLRAFYHVGEHGNTLLEGADWNDCYDLARNRGESPCFFAWYAHNMRLLADLLERQGGEVTLLKEMMLLLDRVPGASRVDYSSVRAKRRRLAKYFEAVKHRVSGHKVNLKASDLAADLRAKADQIVQHLHDREWLTTRDGESFFNGHYDDAAVRIGGDNPKGVRMDLTTQVLATLCGTATEGQVDKMYHAAKRYLRDPRRGGLRLNTEFKELKLNFGRVTAFAYGYKEHGSIYNHMNVMYFMGLYRRNRVREGYEVFRDVYRLCADSASSLMFPGMPSFIDLMGRGRYNYSSGAATWMMCGVLTEMFGIRGQAGDVRLEPKLVREQFGRQGWAEGVCSLHDRRIRVRYINPRRKDWGQYGIARISINGRQVFAASDAAKPFFVLAKDEFLRCCQKKENLIEVFLD